MTGADGADGADGAVTSVFLADDDDRFRAAYRTLFSRTPGFRFAGEAADGSEAHRLVAALRPDVVLLDVQMPLGSGLMAAERILSTTATKVIVLTTFDLDEYVEVALRLGVAGFLLKNASPSEVLAAVRAVHAGNAALAPEVTARVMARFSARPAEPRHPFAAQVLSAREVQVIRRVARGYSNRQIADELHLSLETVRTYLRRMFAKLDVNDRTHLAVLAYQAGLLHEPRR